jgi:hypothetical protein
MQHLSIECADVSEACHWLQFMAVEAENRTIRIIVDIISEEEIETLLEEEVHVLSGKHCKQ